MKRLTNSKVPILNIPILFFILLCSPYFVEGADSERRMEQIKQIESDLSREKEKFLKFDFKEKDLLDQLSSMEKDINEKRLTIKELEEKIENTKRELENSRGKLARIEQSLEQDEDLFGKRFVAFYKNAKRGYLKVLANAEGLNQLNHMLKYLRQILDQDQQVLGELIETQQNYKKQVSIIEEQVKAVENLEEEEKERLVSLKADLDKKVLLLSKIHKEREFYETAVKELQSAAQNMHNTIVNLEKAKPKKENLPTDFIKSKGKLPLPVQGEIIRNLKKSGELDLSSYKGIYIQSDIGADVTAVYPGRIDFSGKLKGYGEVIVINHGTRYFTISAYLSKRAKEEGEMVAKGERIGIVGETGFLTGPALYFEIRRGEDNVNPMQWLKVN